jgi:hypothetical protein
MNLTMNISGLTPVVMHIMMDGGSHPHPSLRPSDDPSYAAR